MFWVSFVLIGQPLAALLYFFAWEAKYGSHLKGKAWGGGGVYNSLDGRVVECSDRS